MTEYEVVRKCLTVTDEQYFRKYPIFDGIKPYEGMLYTFRLKDAKHYEERKALKVLYPEPRTLEQNNEISALSYKYSMEMIDYLFDNTPEKWCGDGVTYSDIVSIIKAIHWEYGKQIHFKNDGLRKETIGKILKIKEKYIELGTKVLDDFEDTLKTLSAKNPDLYVTQGIFLHQLLTNTRNFAIFLDDILERFEKERLEQEGL